jgi:hypothetical protein
MLQLCYICGLGGQLSQYGTPGRGAIWAGDLLSDNLARANRLRALANEITTPSLKVGLLAVAKECECLAGRKKPDPKVDPTLVKVRRERAWP